MDKYLEIKTEYEGMVDFLNASLPDEQFGEALMLYYLAATLKIWGSNFLYSPDYKTLLSCVLGKDYTIEQVVTAMGCCGDEERLLAVPDFFDKLVKKDAENSSDLASSFIEKLNDILFASATINGDFTVEEANCLSQIIGANSVVGSDIEPYTIVAGNPTKILRKRFDDKLVELLLKFKWWNKSIEEINDLIPILTCSDLEKVREELQKQLA